MPLLRSIRERKLAEPHARIAGDIVTTWCFPRDEGWMSGADAEALISSSRSRPFGFSRFSAWASSSSSIAMGEA